MGHTNAHHIVEGVKRIQEHLWKNLRSRYEPRHTGPNTHAHTHTHTHTHTDHRHTHTHTSYTFISSVLHHITYLALPLLALIRKNPSGVMGL